MVTSEVDIAVINSRFFVRIFNLYGKGNAAVIL